MSTTTTTTNETRTLDVFGISEGLEVRFTPGEAGKPNRLIGYAAVFNSLSSDLGGFKERVVAGAFKESISSNTDIRALVGHDSAKLLGRTKNSTLRMSEDERGLRVEIDLPDVSYAKDMMELVKRGDIKGMSFGFRVRGDNGQRFTREGGQTIRELRSIDLKEVSVVATPAYDATSLQLRVDPAAVEQAKTTVEAPTLASRKMQLRKMIAA
ncbi:MAG TPA: HK97 family phage prohead protease [Tepidisphaeraceae bacterium]|nr:HK97 family phage prohead protease [Tepidisphaeraceae bacterium]